MGQQKGLQVLVEFSCGREKVALHGRLFEGAVQAFNGAVGSGMSRLGEAVLHAVFPADSVKVVSAGQKQIGLRC